jgi:hypothetical protein
MRKRFSGSMLMIAVAVAAAAVSISTPIPRASAQAPANSGAPPAPALKTPWGEPDLQGIWTDETDTPPAVEAIRSPPKETMTPSPLACPTSC